MRGSLRILFPVAFLAGSAASGAVDGPGSTQVLRAVRAPSPLAIDGRLDEAAWQLAPAFDGFVQGFPKEGAAPSERTELRVLYDEQNLYVSFLCLDSRPGEIARALGRRDQPPASDLVAVAIDSKHDHRAAFAFAVNAGGVQLDGLFYEDSQFTTDWDAVWDAQVALRPDGWSAELSIPLQVLAFGDGQVQTWGFAAKRFLSRTHEELLTVMIPRGTNAFVSRLGHLTGVEVRPRQALELSPYLASRAALRPEVSGSSIYPSADVGMDLRASLGPRLTLNATVNPDFGQVESDRMIVNLSSFEAFLPEKRPFFTQGLELFRPVGSDDDGKAPQTLFYSRRIGLDAPILAAAKLTGAVGDELQLGLVDAVVADGWQASPGDAIAARRASFRLERPLHFGLEGDLPDTRPVPRNFFAAVGRRRLGGNSVAGATFAAATPLGNCESQGMPTDCLAGSNAAAIDFDLRTPDGQYVAMGQLDGSQVVGGPARRVLRDGTVLGPGELGFGAYLTAGKLGGDPFRFKLEYAYESPKLELNAAGYQRTQNQQQVRGTVRWVRPNGVGPLHRLDGRLSASGSWTTDGRAVNRGNQLSVAVESLLPGFHFAGCEAGAEDGAYDVREIAGSGIPYQRSAGTYLVCYGESDSTRAVSVAGFAGLARVLPLGPMPGGGGFMGELTAVARPHPRLESRVVLGTENVPLSGRYIGSPGPSRYLFGDLDAHSASLTLRQQIMVTPRLTLQGYAQLLTAYGRFERFYEASSEGQAPIRAAELSPVVLPEDGFRTSALNLSLVLRWEYRLGSTVHAVYTRSQQEAPSAPGVKGPWTLLPTRLGEGPASDSLMLKWSYFWDA